MTLKGDLATPALRADAERIATGVPNVQQVVNEIDVKNQRATSSQTAPPTARSKGHEGGPENRTQAKTTQPAMKQTPPIGVIAPRLAITGDGEQVEAAGEEHDAGQQQPADPEVANSEKVPVLSRNERSAVPGRG